MKRICSLASFSFMTALLLAQVACIPSPGADPLAGFVSTDSYILHQYSEAPYANPVILKKQARGQGLLYILSFQTETHGQWIDMLGYHLLERSANGTRWVRSKGGGFWLGQPEPASPYANIQVAIGGSSDGLDPIVIYGQVRDPQVKQIQLLSTEEVRLLVVENDVFGEIVSHSVNLCAVLILDGKDQVLDRVNLTEKYAGLPGIAKSEACAKRWK